MSGISDFVNSILPIVKAVIPGSGNYLPGGPSTYDQNASKNISKIGQDIKNDVGFAVQHPTQVPQAVSNYMNSPITPDRMSYPLAQHMNNPMTAALTLSGDVAGPEGGVTEGAPLPPVQADLTPGAIGGRMGPKINIPDINRPIPPESQGPQFPDKPLASDLPPTQKAAPELTDYSGESAHTHSPTLPTESDRLRGIMPDGKTIKTPDEVRQINATLNGYGIKGSLTDQLQATSNKIGELSNQAKTIVANQGGTLPKSDLINLAAKQIVETPGVNIPPSQAINEATKYIDQVYGKVAGVHPNELEGFISPDQIPGTVAQDMKTIMNQENSSTFTSDPASWTKGQIISRPAGDALDRILDTVYPEASRLNNDMSDLYKAKGSLLKGSQGEIKAAQSAPPPPGFFGKVSNAVGAIAKNPVAQVLGLGEAVRGGSDLGNLATMVGGELSRLPDQIANEFGYTKKAQGPTSQVNGTSNNNTKNLPSSIHTFTDIPQKPSDINPGEQLADPSQIKGPDNSPLTITQPEYKAQSSQLQATIDNYKQLGIPVPPAILQKKYALDTQWSASDPTNPNSLTGKYSSDSKIVGAAQDASSLLNTVSPNFFNQFKNWDQLQSNTDPQYADLKAKLSVLHSFNAAGVDGLFTAGSKEVAQRILGAAIQAAGWDYYQTFNTYTGNTGAKPTNIPTATSNPSFGATQANPQGLSDEGNTMQGSGFKPQFFQEQ